MNLSNIKHILNYMENNFLEIYSHSERVSLLCYVLARELKLSHKETELCYVSGLLHEIGKIYIPEEIKIKDGIIINSNDIYFRFTNCVLSTYEDFDRVIKIITQHQENYDGSGIPGDFKEDEIDVLSIVLRICDFYDTQKMSGLIHDDITKLLRKNANIIFPNKIITPFIKSVIKNDLKEFEN